jgi:hypothetical protein
MRLQVKTLAHMAIFIAFMVVAGYSLIQVPNVELVTAMAFFAGAALGPSKGLAVGATGELLFGLINPLGISAVPLLVSQVAGMAVAGFVGGVVTSVPWVQRAGWGQAFVFATSGLGITLLFDLLTTLGFLIMSGLTIQTLVGAYLYGGAFYVTHAAMNTLIFATVLPVMLRVAQAVPFLNSRRVTG